MKCDELKAYNVVATADVNPEVVDSLGCTEWAGYDKSEADKVIAEKDEEIARLKAIRKVHVEAIESMEAGLLQDEEENRHSKYKRCLAMARWCMAIYNECAAYYPTTTTRIMKFLDKWEKRWRELADKFKPNSTAQ